RTPRKNEAPSTQPRKNQPLLERTRPEMSQHKYHGHLGHNHHNPRPLRSFQGIDFNDSKGTPVRAATSPKPGRTGWNVIPGLGHTGHGMTTDEYLAAEMYRRESMEFAKNYMQKRYGRKQIVKVQKITHDWIWTCRICDHFFMSTKWSIIIKTANHHARQHETK